jgi:hypothetical protein
MATTQLLDGSMDKTRAAIAAFGYCFGTEEELQIGLAKALEAGSVSFRREVALSKRDRIDFMLDDGIGIEVKIDGSISALTRQLLVPQADAPTCAQATPHLTRRSRTPRLDA